ncbi:histone-lysine N-methyltransferase SETMAR [Trichonephila clavipes]|uniref:Histone-lysine N-methyltransferase SETMAR n=1 Tax=Trichonephila clavipes TaxID=2585209 RepID=A0A8X6UQX5_TRICX|nr:histone-lysine N-methyltransferase SETMAR [Trichonephila clavipes]
MLSFTLALGQKQHINSRHNEKIVNNFIKRVISPLLKRKRIKTGTSDKSRLEQAHWDSLRVENNQTERNNVSQIEKENRLLGKTPTETYSMLVRVCEGQALSMKCVYERFTRFREGRESVSDNLRSERPTTFVSDENIERRGYDPSSPKEVHDFFSVHDNALPHTANIAKQFLAKKRVVQIEHPPFSPYLNPPEFFLFRRFKLDIPDIQRNVTRLLNSIPKKTSCKVFSTCITDLSGAEIWETTISKDSKVTFVNISSALMLHDYSPLYCQRFINFLPLKIERPPSGRKTKRQELIANKAKRFVVLIVSDFPFFRTSKTLFCCRHILRSFPTTRATRV